MISESVSRIESREKVTGSLPYLEDTAIAGMLHAALLRSPLPHAEIVSIDASAAEALPGVAGVLTRQDVRNNPHHGSHYGPVLKDQSIVALDRVRYVGDVVAAVAADRPEIAEEALELIQVEYRELPAVFDPEEALAEGAPVLHQNIELPEEGPSDLQQVERREGSNLCHYTRVERGNVEQGFSQSDRIFESVFSCASSQHALLESFVSVARFESSGKLTLWSTTQHPFLIRDEMAQLFRLPLSKVRVVALNLGAGFGGKGYLKLEPVVAALAHKVQRPVSLRLSREETFQTIVKHAARIYVKTGVQSDGRILARHCRLVMDTGAYAEIGPRVVKKAAYTSAGPYQIPNLRVDACLAYTNSVPAGAFRGFGVPQAAWGCESAMDVVARGLQMDPLELRLKNLLDEGGTFVTGERIDSFGIRECLEKVRREIQWEHKSPPTGSKRRGKGLACCIEATMTPTISSAALRLNEDGSATVYVGTTDMGQGSDTVLAQITAAELALPLEQIAIVHSDTDRVPYDLKTAASRSTFHMGLAIQRAARDIRRQLACMAAPLYQTSPEDFIFENQTLRPRQGESEGLSYAALLERHFGIKGANLLALGVLTTSNTNRQGDYQYSVFWVAGVGAAEVEVDTQTGQVRLLRYVTAADVGKALNPLACHQQLRGGVITGIGQTLLEQLVYREGLLINPNFLDYNLPRFPDMPQRIQTILVEHPCPEGPYGAKGVGEIGTIPVSPAIVNAIEDAVGVRIRDLPVTSERVLEALQGRHHT